MAAKNENITWQLDTESVSKALEEERSLNDLTTLLTEMQMIVEEPASVSLTTDSALGTRADDEQERATAFSTIGAILFTEIGASAPYYVPVKNRLSMEQLPQVENAPSLTNYSTVIQALFDVCSGFNLSLLHSLASVSPADRDLIYKAFEYIKRPGRKSYPWMNGVMQNVVLDRFWWALTELDSRKSTVSHTGFGLRINKNPPSGVEVVVKKHRDWMNTLTTFIKSWESWKKKKSAYRPPGYLQAVGDAEPKAIGYLSVEGPSATAATGAQTSSGQAQVVSGSVAPAMPDGASATESREGDLTRRDASLSALLETTKPIVLHFINFAKLSKDSQVVEKAEFNFFHAALGLVALMLVSHICFVS